MALFAVMLAVALLCAFVFWINRLFVRRDKQAAIRWLETQGCKVEKIEWVLFPTGGRFYFQRCSTFEVRYEKAGLRHHAFLAIPTLSSPMFLEDEEAPAS